MNFRDLLFDAKAGDESAITKILLMYRPLLIKESIINGVYNEDLYQELCIILTNCIK